MENPFVKPGHPWDQISTASTPESLELNAKAAEAAAAYARLSKGEQSELADKAAAIVGQVRAEQSDPDTEVLAECLHALGYSVAQQTIEQ